MATVQEIAEIKATITQLYTEVNRQSTENEILKTEIKNLRAGQSMFQAVTTTAVLKAETPSYKKPEDINLTVFSAIPVFNGNSQEYRPWRQMVFNLMEEIKQFSGTPQYYHALTIVRTNIQGEAAHILTNQNTIMNFQAIVNRLDYTYADSRPLYVLQEELRRIRQGKLTLSEYYDQINNALNLILSKITMTSSSEGRNIQEHLAMEEAVRIFTANLNSSFTKATLYSNQPPTIERAYAIALTIQHDNMSHAADVNIRRDNPQHNHPHRRDQPHIRQNYVQQDYVPEQRRFRPNYQAQPQRYVTPNHPRAMETDNSTFNQRNPFRQQSQRNFQPQYQRQNNNYQQQQAPNPSFPAIKREREDSGKNHKFQRVNQLDTHKIEDDLVSKLNDFDLILGESGLRQIKAKINLFEYKLEYEQKLEQAVNYTNDSEFYKENIDKLMQRNEDLNETLPFTTTIEATIRTTDNEPIWTKQYPYPYSDNEFVNKEVEKLLKDGIIQKSRSPYNSPIWTVPKKGIDENGRPKRRMVIDFQKLNSRTITDRYPIPDVNMTIQNLGKAKIFSTIDLESGFHQIKIKESDREKTAFAVNGAKYEFIRMPFGLKNAPSIFQRCVDDILREWANQAEKINSAIKANQKIFQKHFCVAVLWENALK
ncbi:uncharacterized protein LOC129944768 [Eupeodes corollae]|uniref:uncharacterized protein LOC129944768 n=1 Tax=Eupeodes corollae TaxID=290404 RepID=UPI0024917037|nr:uncharacterized protein LOC129944768 [Eupeodes corollae]